MISFLPLFCENHDKILILFIVFVLQFGLGVFKWNIPPYRDILTFPGVLSEGFFASTFTVIGNNVVIIQSNTYNHNDFTLLWSHRDFTKGLMKKITTQ